MKASVPLLCWLTPLCFFFFFFLFCFVAIQEAFSLESLSFATMKMLQYHKILVLYSLYMPLKSFFTHVTQYKAFFPPNYVKEV